MRLLLAIVVLAALGWSGWWWFHASAKETAIENWLQDRRNAGWVAEAENVAVTGFPNRVDAMISGLDLADPVSGWAWTAPEFQILSMSWKPTHVIAVWPGEQTIASPYETTTVESELMRGSIVLRPGRSLALERSSIEIEAMNVAGASGWTARIGEALFATRQADADAPPNAHDVSFIARRITPPDAWVDGIGRSGVLPATIDAAEIDATVAFDRPIDRNAIEIENPGVEEIIIRDASFTWGELDLRGKGRLTADSRGYAAGEIELRARNWRAMIDVAEAAGALNFGLAGPLRAGLDLLAMLSGDRNALSAPLTFEDGNMRLGPIVLGDAPRIGRR